MAVPIHKMLATHERTTGLSRRSQGQRVALIDFYRGEGCDAGATLACYKQVFTTHSLWRENNFVEQVVNALRLLVLRKAKRTQIVAGRRSVYDLPMSEMR